MKHHWTHSILLLLIAFLFLSLPVNAKTSYKSTATTICSAKTRVNVRKGPGLKYAVKTTLKKGQKVTKIGTYGSWTAIKLQSKRYYVKSNYLKQLYKYIYVAADGVNLRSGPGLDYRVKAVLPRNTKLKCTGTKGNWMKVLYQNSTAYINKPLTATSKSKVTASTGSSSSKAPSSSGTSTSSGTSGTTTSSLSSIRSKAIAAVTSRIGETYSQSKRNLPGYADCSSLTRDAFLSASGVNIGETTDQQISRLSNYQKPLSALQPGDILMRIQNGSNHAAIYIGNHYYVHASSTLGKVAKSYYITGSTYWTCCYDAAAYCNSKK